MVQKKAAGAKAAAPKAPAPKGKVVPAKGAKHVQPAKPVDAHEALFVERPRSFGIGGDLLPKQARDVSRFVRWPLYVKRQRQQRVLERRLRIPPSVNQFRRTLDKINATELFKLAAKYKPETQKAQRKRLRALAKERMTASHTHAKAAKKAAKASPKSGTKPTAKAKKSSTAQPAKAKQAALTFGIQQVTRAVEHKKAKLVLIAHDVDPLEIVLTLPALCHAQGIPYAIVKGKAALGRLVGFKTAVAVAFEHVRGEDASTFANIVKTVNTVFSEKYDEVRRQWGGNQVGIRAKTKLAKRRKTA